MIVEIDRVIAGEEWGGREECEEWEGREECEEREWAKSVRIVKNVKCTK